MRLAALRHGDNEMLGYDPRPRLGKWCGTPIPPVRDPLKASPERDAIAGRVWWNGPPWTVLRNALYYVWHVMDYGTDADVAFTRCDVSERLWRQALHDARPGLVSRGSYVLWSCVFGLMADDEVCQWPDTAHLKDLRPTGRDTREQMYQRAAAYHNRRLKGL